MSQNRGLAAVAVVVQQFLAGFDVSGRHQDQPRASVNGVQLRLAVSRFTVVDESPETVRFLRSVHTVEAQGTTASPINVLDIKEKVNPAKEKRQI